jgi:hypothetical protein
MNSRQHPGAKGDQGNLKHYILTGGTVYKATLKYTRRDRPSSPYTATPNPIARSPLLERSPLQLFPLRECNLITEMLVIPASCPEFRHLLAVALGLKGNRNVYSETV